MVSADFPCTEEADAFASACENAAVFVPQFGRFGLLQVLLNTRPVISIWGCKLCA